MKFFKLTTSLAVVVSLTIVLLTEQTQATVQWPGYYADGIKNYLINLVKDRVLTKSKVVSSFRDTMSKIRERYDGQVEALGAEATDVEKQALYYKIVVEELRDLREQVEKETKGGEKSEFSDDIEDSKVIKEGYPVPAPNEIIDPKVDDEEELELLNQLDELESLEKQEAEMGWSLNAESRQLLKERTKKVLGELLENELRHLALAIMTSYISGSPLGPIAAALAGSIRFKLVECLMNMVMDVLASLMGRRINVDQPKVEPVAVPSPQPIPVQPVEQSIDNQPALA